MSEFDFNNVWTLTDEYPVLQWQVQDVDFQLSRSEIGEGETMPITVELTLNDGSTVTASEVADYDSEPAVAAVDAGTLEANSKGQTEITATVAGISDTETVEVLEPPKISLVDANLAGEAVVNGSEMVATATFENTGGPGSESFDVTVDGETVTSDSVSLDPDEEKTITVSWTGEQAGGVELAGESLGSLELVERGTIELVDVTAPDETAANADYDLDLELSNGADLSVVETVSLRVGGETIKSESVTVDAGGSTESITYAHDEQGTVTHVIALQYTEETVSTEILAPAEFVVSDFNAPDELEASESGEVSATVTNEGGGEDTKTVSLTLDEETIDSQELTLDAGESETVTFDVSVDAAGDYALAVTTEDDEASSTLSIADSEASPASSNDDGIPGFGAIPALVALLCAIGFLGSRHRS